MNSDVVRRPELSVAFVLERQQLEHSLATRVLEQFPKAQVFVGPSFKSSAPFILTCLLFLERSLFRYPGRVPTPLDLQPLPVDQPSFDIVIDLRPNGPDKTLLKYARRDLWWLEDVNNAAILRGETSVEISVVGQSDGQRDRRLVSQASIQTKVMISRTQEFAREKALQLIRRELARVALTGELPDLGARSKVDPSVRTGNILGYLKRVVSRVYLAFRTQLNKGFEPGHPFALRSGEGTPDPFEPGRGTVIAHPKRGWYADPFLLERDGDLYCFFEDLPHRSTKAGIGVAKVTGDRFEILGQAVQTDYHLSYPFVFQHEGEVFMLPETLGARRVEIWKATDFPRHWELYATALEGQQLADPVLVEIGSQWWLFANPCNDSIGDFSSELWLFRVDGPGLNHVDPHPLNPVVVGSDTARGGGRVMWHNDRLLRFSQNNCASIYGYGLNIMEITNISEADYQERLLREVTPAQIAGVVGCHHVDFLQGRFVMDVRLP